MIMCTGAQATKVFTSPKMSWNCRSNSSSVPKQMGEVAIRFGCAKRDRLGWSGVPHNRTRPSFDRCHLRWEVPCSNHNPRPSQFGGGIRRGATMHVGAQQPTMNGAHHHIHIRIDAVQVGQVFL